MLRAIVMCYGRLGGADSCFLTTALATHTYKWKKQNTVSLQLHKQNKKHENEKKTFGGLSFAQLEGVGRKGVETKQGAHNHTAVQI